MCASVPLYSCYMLRVRLEFLGFGLDNTSGTQKAPQVHSRMGTFRVDP